MSLRDDVRKAAEQKKAEAAQAWAAFSKRRDEAKASLTVEEIQKEDSPVFKELHDLNQAYGLVADEAKRLEERFLTLVEMDDGPADDPERKQSPDVDMKSFGERYTGATGYKALIDQGLAGSTAAFKGESVLVADKMETKATLTSGATSAGAFITPDRKPPQDPITMPLALTSKIIVSTTDSNMVEYVQETAFTNNAAETAEGATKPESELAFAVIQSPVQTIAHWIPITRQAMGDAGQIEGYVNGRLQFGLRERVEKQVANGTGAAPDLRGILNTVGILTQAKGTDPTPDAILKAITKIRLGFSEPNAVILHPNDWQDVRLLKDTTGQYLFGPPSQAGPSTIWGVPFEATAAVPENTGLVGDFTQAELWIRDGIRVLISDSHADFFVKNMVVLLAEMRAAFGVLRPAAFASITGI